MLTQTADTPSVLTLLSPILAAIAEQELRSAPSAAAAHAAEPGIDADVLAFWLDELERRAAFDSAMLQLADEGA